MPRDQFGVVSGRGTDFASHIVRSFIEYTMHASLSYFVLLVDLVEAFDRVISEIVFRFSHSVSDPFLYLRDLGLPEHQAAWLIEFLGRYRHMFAKWGVDKKVVAQIRNLHANLWFSYGSLDSAIAVRIGGRRGCTFGATVFNCAHALGLAWMHSELAGAGVVLRLPEGRLDF